MKTKHIVADFTMINTLEEMRTQVSDRLKDIDIAMLFTNAGVMEAGAFSAMVDSQIQNQVSVNVLQPTYLCKPLLP